MEDIMKKSIYTTKEIALIALFVALTAVCAWITIPMPEPFAPFTLQTFAVFTALGILGLKNGLTAIIVYCLLGIVGLPVFAGMKGGVGVLLGTTGGYIIGFIFTALSVGLITKKFGKSIPVLAISMVIGLILCYAFGTAWFIVVYTNTKSAVGIASALAWCVTPYILPDLVKIAVAITIVKAVEKSKVMRTVTA